MDIGVAFFPTHDAIDPGALAGLVEERGLESLFFPEHTHIPASRQSQYPAGGTLPRKYFHTYDLFVAMTAAAVATTRLRVGSGICLLIERDPITTAKEVASIDHLSGGRFEFGVGAGWNREEMPDHGTDPRKRMRVMAERIEAMQETEQLKIVPGGVRSAHTTSQGVDITLVERRLRVGAVINCTGPSADVRRSPDPLVRGLLHSRLARPAPLFLGLDTDTRGCVPNTDDGLWVVGPLRRGERWESTAIPEIRMQAAALSHSLRSTSVPVNV